MSINKFCIHSALLAIALLSFSACGGSSTPTQPTTPTSQYPELIKYEGSYNIEIPFDPTYSPRILSISKIAADNPTGPVINGNPADNTYNIVGTVDRNGALDIIMTNNRSATDSYTIKAAIDGSGNINGNYYTGKSTTNPIKLTGVKTFADIAGEWETTQGNRFTISKDGTVSGLKLTGTTTGNCYGGGSGGVSSFADPNPVIIDANFSPFELPKLRPNARRLTFAAGLDDAVVTASMFYEQGELKYGGDVTLSYKHVTSGYSCTGSIDIPWRARKLPEKAQ